MALAKVCSCAPSACFVALVVLGSALAGLCLPHVTETSYSHISFDALVASRNGESGISHLNRSLAAIRSTGRINVSVRSVALKHLVDVRLGEDRHPEEESLDGDDVRGSTWRKMEGIKSEEEDVHRIGKRMTVTRRGRRARSLRLSKPYPCALSPGACRRSESCCGSVCADVATNLNHCGRCGHICRPDRACCNGKCRRLATDERNCGRCGSRCAPGTKCLFGLCGY